MLASNRPSIQSFSPSAHDSGTLSTLVMARPAGRRRIVLENQGLLGIAFFEASAFVILLVLFPLFRRERSEEHTSELQSRLHLVCRLLLEKKKQRKRTDGDSPPD